MAPKFPDEVDVFAVPHSRMKALVDIYMEQLSQTDFCSNGALEALLQNLEKTFCEFKTHEYIENQFIMERLKQRLKMVNVSSRAVCNCHKDNRLVEILKLLRDGYNCTQKSVNDRITFGVKLQKVISEFTEIFIPHMQEEEDVFQPLLVKYFAYDELKSLKDLVIQQHELWKEKVQAEKENVENLFHLLSSLASEVADYCSSDSEDEFQEALQTLVELTCENLTKKKKSKPNSINFNHLPDEMILNIFSYLNPPDRGRCAKVCKLWNLLVYTPNLWREIYPSNWSRGLWDFHYYDSYLQAENELMSHYFDKNSESITYGDNEDEPDSELQFYEQFVLYVLPRIGDGVQRLVAAGDRRLNSQLLRSMLILCPNLQHLDVSYSNVTDLAFKGLAIRGACSQLIYLDLSGCSSISDVGLQRLGDCFQSKFGSTITSKPNGKMCSSCYSCQGCFVYRSSDDVSDEENENIYNNFSRGLSHLNLSGCKSVTDLGLKSLLDVSLQMQSLTFMDLSGCPQITGCTLTNVVMQCPQLQPQDLYYCNMIEEGPYPDEANGCQNLGCPLRACCCLGD